MAIDDSQRGLLTGQNKREEAPATRGCISTRWEHFVLMSLSCCLCYMGRANVSIAADGSRGIAAEKGWDNSRKGMLLSAFFYGYASTQLVGGWAATRYGGKRVLLAVVAGSSLCNLAFPLLCRAGDATTGLALAMAVRAFAGLCQGPMSPTNWSLLATWAPLSERSRAASLYDAGSPLGTIAIWAVAPLLMRHFGWAPLFYVPGVLGIAWAVVWAWRAASSPEEHSRMPAAERAWLLASRQQLGGAELEKGEGRMEHKEEGQEATAVKGRGRPSPPLQRPQRTPWSELLRSPAVWAFCCNNFTCNWSFYTLLTFLPTYMTDELDYSLGEAGAFAVVPFIGQVIGTLAGGSVGDWLLGYGLRVITVRTIMTAAAALPPAAFLVAVPYAASASTAVALFTLSLAWSGCQSSGFQQVGSDVFPAHAGVIKGMANTFGTLPGIVSPAVTGFILDAGRCPADSDGKRSALASERPQSCARAWRDIFFISAAVYVFGAAAFAALASRDTRYKKLELERNGM